MVEALKQECLSSEIVNTSQYIKNLYKNQDDCYVRLLCKTSGKHKMYSINSLKDNMKLNQIIKSFGVEDLMISINEFKTMKSATRNNLFAINNIAVDVDYKKIKEFKDLTPVQVINLLELEFFNYGVIPAPTYIEYSNQIRLIYSIETCYIPKNNKSVVILAQRVSEVFAEKLKDYGAEKQNIESFIRVPHSINTKNGAVCKVISYDNYKYKLDELQELWLDELPKWYKRKKGKTKVKKVVKLHNVYALNCNRLLDFEKIQAYLNSINANDLRARLCFQYRNYTLIKLRYQNGELKKEDYDLAKEAMLNFNRNFNNPLQDHSIESATRVVN